MLAESQLPCARDWKDLKKRLAFLKKNELAGDEKFFHLLEQNLKQEGEEASERLTIYYTCIGLGFTGDYEGQPEALRAKMKEILLRIRGHIEADSAARICPEAYKYDDRDLIEPPTGRVWLMVVIFAVCALTSLACYVVAFRHATEGLRGSLDFIIRQEKHLGVTQAPTGK